MPNYFDLKLSNNASRFCGAAVLTEPLLCSEEQSLWSNFFFELHKLFAGDAFTMQHCPNAKLKPNCIGLKLPNGASRVCVAALLMELQMIHISTEHEQRVWTK